jgi:hypothetical protein
LTVLVIGLLVFQMEQNLIVWSQYFMIVGEFVDKVLSGCAPQIDVVLRNSFMLVPPKVPLVGTNAGTRLVAFVAKFDPKLPMDSRGRLSVESLHQSKSGSLTVASKNRFVH